MDKAGLHSVSSTLKMNEVRRTQSVASDDISTLSDGTSAICISCTKFHITSC